MQLTDLPAEILSDIAEAISNTPDLRNLRTVSYQLRKICTPSLFRSVKIEPRKQSEREQPQPAPKWYHMAEDDELRFHVRYAIIHFDANVRDPTKLVNYFTFWFPDTAPTVRSRFPNLRSLNWRLPRSMRGSSRGREDFYKAVSRVSTCAPGSLTISLLDPLDDGYDGLPVVDVLKLAPNAQPGSLQRLHLCFTRRELDFLALTRDPGVDHSMERDYKALPKRLKQIYLKPNAGFLTHMSLYCGNYWGAFPYVDFTGLNFPKLKSLSLGNYCFAFPGQLESLLSLQTIEELLLDDCPIVFLVLLPGWSLERANIDTSNWKELGEATPELGMDTKIFTAKAECSWSEYFDKLAVGLPRLRQFGFRPGDWTWREDRPKAIEQHNEFSVNWHPQSRYTAYNARDDSWFEVLSKPPGLDDQFFRVDLDKELNWKFSHFLGHFIEGGAPQVEEARIKGDIEGLQRLLRTVEARARVVEAQKNSR